MKTLNAPGDLNVSRVLRLIWQNKGISRIEIAHELGIDKSTVTKIVCALEENGIIRAYAEGEAGPQGGRKPIRLEIAGEFAAVAGIEISTDGFLLTVVDLNGVILYTAEEREVPSSVFASFRKAMKLARAEAERRGIPLISAGVGVPAIVNTDTGSIIQSIPLMIREETSFAAPASDEFGISVHIDNDARCGSYGEILIRRGQSPENALFLLSEIRRITGSQGSKKNLSAGFGFIINGQPCYGSTHAAGEFRSILWKPGNSGQFQSDDLTGEKIGSDRGATGTILDELAAHTALIINLFNLDYVFLGGLPEDLTAVLAGKITAETVKKWPYEVHVRCSVVSASMGTRAVAFGAAAQGILRFFALPNIAQASGSGLSVMETLTEIRQKARKHVGS